MSCNTIRNALVQCVSLLFYCYRVDESVVNCHWTLANRLWRLWEPRAADSCTTTSSAPSLCEKREKLADSPMKFAPYRDRRKAAGWGLVGSDGSFQSQVTWSLSLFTNKWCSALKQVDGGTFNMCAKCVMCWLCATAVDTVPNQTTQCVRVFPCDLEIIQKEPECLWLGSSLHVCVRKADRTVFSQVSASIVLCKNTKTKSNC